MIELKRAVICPFLAIAMAMGNPLYGDECPRTSSCAMWSRDKDRCGLRVA